MYSFKPFVFTKHIPNSLERPKARSGHRIVCDEKNLYSYGGFNPSVSESDPDMQFDETWTSSKPLFKELWRFNLTTQYWKRLPGRESFPNELASNAVILRGSSLMVYGGTGVPFGFSCSNHLYVCNVNSGKMEIVPARGERPEPQYGQALISHGSYLYTVGGTTGYEYTCDIHRLNLNTGVWEVVYICKGTDLNEPKGRYRHELAFDGKMIYVLGGGTSIKAYEFSEIPAFDIEKNMWYKLHTYGSTNDNLIPAARRCHGSVQYTNEKTGETSVVISGGYNGDHAFSDVWKLDLKSLQWTCLKKCVLPSPVYFHSAAVTPQGRMYIFGGIIKEKHEITRTDKVHSVWLTIPRLSEISWEALNYYYPEIRLRTQNELFYMGVPMKFAKRIDGCDW